MNYKDLLKAGIHFGHNTSRWNPKMRPYIWGARNKVHLIDISKTAFLMERAGKFIQEITSKGKQILWVGTKKAAQVTLEGAAAKTTMPYVVHRWIGGTLSNYEQVKKAVTRLLHLRDVVEKSLGQYGKKEQSMITKEVARLEKNVGGIIDLNYPPGAIIVVDAKKERSAIQEAKNLGIPVVAIVDTNTDPTGIPFVIPANDDSPRSIGFVVDYLSTYIQEGVKTAEKNQAAEKAAKAAAKAAKEAEKKAARPATKEVVTTAAKPGAKKAKPPVTAEKPTAEAKPAAKQAKPAAKAEKPTAQKQSAPAKKPDAKQAKPATKKEAAPAKKETAK